MIIDKSLDRSLYCILKSDNENREEILDFLNEIPTKVLQNIKFLLKENKDKESFIFKGECTKHDGTNFCFLVCCDGAATHVEIKHYLFANPNNNNIFMNYVISLCLAKEHLTNDEIDYDDPIWIGDFSHTVQLFSKSQKIAKIFSENLTPSIDYSRSNAGESLFENDFNIEYNFVKYDNGCAIQREFCSIENTDESSININAIPSDITIDSLNKEFRHPKGTKKLHL